MDNATAFVAFAGDAATSKGYGPCECACDESGSCERYNGCYDYDTCDDNLFRG